MLIIHYLPRRQLGFVVSRDLRERFLNSEIGNEFRVLPIKPKQELSCLPEPITYFMLTTHVRNLRAFIGLLEEFELDFQFIDEKGV